LYILLVLIRYLYTLFICCCCNPTPLRVPVSSFPDQCLTFLWPATSPRVALPRGRCSPSSFFSIFFPHINLAKNLAPVSKQLGHLASFLGGESEFFPPTSLLQQKAIDYLRFGSFSDLLEVRIIAFVFSPKHLVPCHPFSAHSPLPSPPQLMSSQLPIPSAKISPQ